MSPTRILRLDIWVQLSERQQAKLQRLICAFVDDFNTGNAKGLRILDGLQVSRGHVLGGYVTFVEPQHVELNDDHIVTRTLRNLIGKNPSWRASTVSF